MRGGIMNRFLKLTALGSVVVAVLIAMILRTGLASATSGSSCGGWNVVSSPSPSSAFNYLHGIAAVSANDIWAVGFSNWSWPEKMERGKLVSSSVVDPAVQRPPD